MRLGHLCLLIGADGSWGPTLPGRLGGRGSIFLDAEILNKWLTGP